MSILITTPRVSDPQGLLLRADPQLAAIVAAAAAGLPAAWRPEIAEADGVALEIEILTAHGRLARRTRYEAGTVYQAYRRLADQAYRVQRRLHPDLTGQLAWGGRWTDVGGWWLVGRFDLAGVRGRGHYRPPAT
jgi:hypothetical protein